MLQALPEEYTARVSQGGQQQAASLPVQRAPELSGRSGAVLLEPLTAPVAPAVPNALAVAGECARTQRLIGSVGTHLGYAVHACMRACACPGTSLLPLLLGR